MSKDIETVKKNDNIPNRGLLTFRQAAVYLGCSIETLVKYYLVGLGFGVYQRNERLFLYKKEIDLHIESNLRAYNPIGMKGVFRGARNAITKNP